MANFRMDDRIEFVTCTTVEDEDGIKKKKLKWHIHAGPTD